MTIDLEPEPSTLLQTLRRLTVVDSQRDFDRQGWHTPRGFIEDKDIWDMGLGGSMHTLPAPHLGTQYTGNGTADTAPVKLSITEAVEGDLKKQRATANAGRVTRTAVRAMREIDDRVFEAAGVNPKYHRENFTKIIDEIMKSL